MPTQQFVPLYFQPSALLCERCPTPAAPAIYDAIINGVSMALVCEAHGPLQPITADSYIDTYQDGPGDGLCGFSPDDSGAPEERDCFRCGAPLAAGGRCGPCLSAP